MTRAFKYILLLTIISLTWSCQDNMWPWEDIPNGSGSITLTLSSQDDVTLETKSNLTEGLEFSNLMVLLTNNSGVIVKKVYLSDINPSTNSQSVNFTDLSPGNYTVYAYANITSTEWQKSGEHIADYAITEGTTNISAFIDKELVTLTSTDIPSYPSTAMLLTGKKDIVVGLTATNETIQLKRPVSRLKVYVRNHTTQAVTINDIHFSHINPDKAYVIEHTDSEGQPLLPAGTSYRLLPAFSTTLGDVASVSGTQAGDTPAKVLVYSRLLYENKSTNSYKLFANMTLGSSTMELGERPFGPIDYYTLNSMDVDESVDVLLVNPQIAKRSGRIFCYISSDNYMAWESAGYESYSDYFGRAREIYYGSTDSQEGTDVMGENSVPTANGYTRWYGDASKIPDKNNTETAAYQFCTVRKINYEPEANKQNKYFHALSKGSDGLFTFSGLAYNNNDNDKRVTGSTITKLRIEEGTVNNKIPQDIRGKLVRFKATNSTGSGFNNRYMQANAYYDANEARKVESNLKFVSGGSTNQDRQFILFGKYVSGGQLKRLESGTNKEITLTYMSRNEDIEVVIDVYYADQTGILSFEVNNTYWTTPVTSTHTFN